MQAKETPAMAIEKPSLRVLVVDDEQLIAESLVTIFRQNGFSADCAYSGYGAIEMAKEQEPDVVISDVLMPGINGIDVALTLSRRLPKARFVMLSGHAGFQENLNAARARGLSFLYLEKPIPPKFLIGYLEDCQRELKAGPSAVFA
jgi:YesN/AraC family two-component response regulator